jgi:uncharacterized protein YjiS (DUF1127 family)
MSYFQNTPTDPISGVLMRAMGTGQWLTRFSPLAVLQLLARLAARTQMRRQLAQLDERQLRDIGVSPIEVRREIIKPFWSE